MSSKNITAIEIDTDVVRMVVLSGHRIVKACVKHLPEESVQNGEPLTDKAMADFLKNMAKKGKIRRKSAVVMLKENDIFTRRLTMPYMNDDQILLNLPSEFHDFMAESTGGFNYDYVILNTIKGGDGKSQSLDIQAAAAPKARIERIKDIINSAGFKLVGAVPVTSSYANLISNYEAKNEIKENRVYCIVDLGFSRTHLHIFKNDVYEVTREIERGYGSVVSAISKLMDVDRSVAFDYMMTDKDHCNDLAAVRDIYDAITIEIMRAINFYSFNNPNDNLHALYYCGGGSKIEALVESIDLDVNIEKGDINELVGDDSLEDASLFAGAFGAGLTDEPKSLNLIKKKKKRLKPWRVLLGLLFVFVFLGLFFEYGVMEPLSDIGDEEAKLDEAYDELYLYEINNSDYDDVLSEYKEYSSDYLRDDEKALIDRTHLLSMLDKDVLSYGNVSNIEINDDEISLSVDGVTLTTVSKIVMALDREDEVSYVFVSMAATEGGVISASSEDMEAFNGDFEGKPVQADITITLVGGDETDE